MGRRAAAARGRESSFVARRPHACRAAEEIGFGEEAKSMRRAAASLRTLGDLQHGSTKWLLPVMAKAHPIGPN